MWYTGVAYTSVTSATHASDCSRRAAIGDVTFTRTRAQRRDDQRQLSTSGIDGIRVIAQSDLPLSRRAEIIGDQHIAAEQPADIAWYAMFSMTSATCR